MLPIWKAAAPAIDLLAPDIYMSDGAALPQGPRALPPPRQRPLRPRDRQRARSTRTYFFAALGQQAIGWAPFGIDYTAYVQARSARPSYDRETLAPFALNYRLVAPMMRELARLSFDGKLKAVAEEKDEPAQTIDLRRWKAIVSLRRARRSASATTRRGNPEPIGRALVAELGREPRSWSPAAFCRVDFQMNGRRSASSASSCAWKKAATRTASSSPIRIWNGDETDWGLNFSSAPQVLRVTLGTY